MTDDEWDLLGQRLDEVEDVGVPTRLLNLCLRHFRLWLGGAEKNIEADGASVQRLRPY